MPGKIYESAAGALLVFAGAIAVVLMAIGTFVGAISGIFLPWILFGISGLFACVAFLPRGERGSRRPGMGPRSGPQRQRLVASGVSITALVTGGYALWSTHGFARDGTDPVKSRCANTQVYLDSRGVSTAAGEPLGTAHILTSRRCGTKWLEVDIKAADGLVMKSIARDHIKEWLPFTLPNKYVELDSDHGDGVSRSQQIWAPGETCVRATVDVFDQAGGQLATTGSWTYCG